MSKLDITDRLEFLAKQFDVFEATSDEDIEAKCDAMVEGEWEESERLFFTANGTVEQTLGIVSKKKNKNGFTLKKISVPYNIFTDMIGADPTPNKICLQWMLNTYTKYLKNEDEIESAVRFAFEDLPQANEYLTLFEANKRKKRFKKMGKFSLKDIKDITNINEYESLSQLYDAVDPFIERDPSNIEKQMLKYLKMGEAEIPFKDRKYTIFIPKSTDANVIFGNFASWCTARQGNSQFIRYTSEHRQPNGDKSNIYIVIDNGFFKGENENIYQLHFESSTHQFGQIMNKSNSSAFDFYKEVLVNSEGVRNYFGDVLTKSAKSFKGLPDKNHYIDALLKFGFSDILFDMLDVNTPIIRIDKETNKKNRKVTRICDISRFSDLETLVIMEASLNELHPSIGSLKKLEMLSFFGNNIKELPTEIGNLSNLIFLNLVGNPITVIPENIKNLDKSNGGMLHRVAIDKKYISEANYQKLRELLPSALFH